MSTKKTLGFPKLPSSCPKISVDSMSLQDTCEYMKSLKQDNSIRQAILLLVEQWLNKRNSVTPLLQVRNILDTIRLLPRSEKRLIFMNTFVKTLGEPEVFANFLDMVRNSYLYPSGSSEQLLSEISRKSSKHAVYGWCAQTRLSLSSTEPTPNTLQPEQGVQSFLGKTPISAWSLSMHIWQPNPNAKGFVCGHNNITNVIAEPPHTHPFDFTSVVVTGQMHQSVYAQSGSINKLFKNKEVQKGRYDGIILEHVHGVWPPHDHSEKSTVITLEDRVQINTGDSYYMPSNIIHDVQVDSNLAKQRPTITLFLRSESYVKPHVYMSSSMANFHAANTNLKNQGYPLPYSAWDKKLELVANYVRGKASTLNLDKIVKYDDDYAFFHV